MTYRFILIFSSIIGRFPERFIVNKGYRGHKWDEPHTRVFQTDQKRSVTPAIKRDIKRLSVIEPIIGHAKNEGLLHRDYLKGRKGNEINAVLSGISFKSRLF